MVNDLIPTERPALLPTLSTNSDNSGPHMKPTTSFTPIDPFGHADFQPPRKKPERPLRPSPRPPRPTPSPQTPRPPRIRPRPQRPAPARPKRPSRRPLRPSPRPPLQPQGLPPQPELIPIGRLVFIDLSTLWSAIAPIIKLFYRWRLIFRTKITKQLNSMYRLAWQKLKMVLHRKMQQLRCQHKLHFSAF